MMFVAVGLPVLLLVIALVVDVGQWYIHKRSLQNEVDAGAFAGSQLWGACFNSTASPAGMYAEAAKYAGGSYNLKAGDAQTSGPMTVYYNSTTFPPDPPPNVGADDTPASPCAATLGADGKNHYFLDLKATEQNVPPIFGSLFSSLAPDIHATARTELREVLALHGLLPLGVPNSNPNFVFAQFVDENWAGSTVSTLSPWIQLTKDHADTTTQYWIAPETSIQMPTDTTHVGIRIRMVGGSDPAAACGQTLVDCYDANSPFGVVHIRTWDASAATPAMRSATLMNGNCSPDAYFSYSGTGTGCNAGVTADIDLGRAPTAADQVWATVDGRNTKFPLTKGAANGTLVTWATGAQDLPFPSIGSHDVQILWNCPSNNQGCVLGDLRSYVATPDGSGPIQGLQVTRLSASPPISGGLNSFQQGSTQSLGLALQTAADFSTLQNAGANQPIVFLRVKGSQNQSFDCDKVLNNIRDEIINGCSNGYTADTDGTACPDYNTLWTTPEPWFCVKVQTGGAVGQVEQGFATRIGTGANNQACANNWSNYPPDDPRIVPLFITPFGSFSGSGNTTVPVTGFAAFYVTGYNGDNCPNATPNVPKSFVAGHFIKYITDDPGATPSSKPCDPLALTPCVPVLIK